MLLRHGSDHALVAGVDLLLLHTERGVARRVLLQLQGLLAKDGLVKENDQPPSSSVISQLVQPLLALLHIASLVLPGVALLLPDLLALYAVLLIKSA